MAYIVIACITMADLGMPPQGAFQVQEFLARNRTMTPSLCGRQGAVVAYISLARVGTAQVDMAYVGMAYVVVACAVVVNMVYTVITM